MRITVIHLEEKSKKDLMWLVVLFLSLVWTSQCCQPELTLVFTGLLDLFFSQMILKWGILQAILLKETKTQGEHVVVAFSLAVLY